MDACFLGIAVGTDGEAAVACAGEPGDDAACSTIPAAELHRKVLSLARGRPARVRVEGPANQALELALRLAQLPAAEVTVMRTAAQRRAESAQRRAARLAAEARHAA